MSSICLSYISRIMSLSYSITICCADKLVLTIWTSFTCINPTSMIHIKRGKKTSPMKYNINYWGFDSPTMTITKNKDVHLQKPIHRSRLMQSDQCIISDQLKTKKKYHGISNIQSCKICKHVHRLRKSSYFEIYCNLNFEKI